MLTISIDEAGRNLGDTIARVAGDRQPLGIGENGNAEVVLIPRAELERLQKIAAAAAGASREPSPTQAMFDLAGRMARLGYWEWDEVTDRCMVCSEELGRLYGMTVDEYLKLMNCTRAWLDRIHPDDRARVEMAVNESRARGGGYNLEYRFRRGDGTELHVNEISEPLLDENGRMVWSTGFVQDITEKKRAERELKESEAMLRSIYAQIPGAVYRRTMRADGSVNYSFISAGMQGVVGYSAEELIADPQIYPNHVHPRDRAARNRAIRRSADTLERYDAEYRFVLPDGEIVWIRAIADPERLDNGDIIWTGMSLDVTDRKRLEVELRRSHDKLEARVRERTASLESANQALEAEIAERRETEAALRSSEALFQRFIDNVPAAIFLKDLEGGYQLANRQYGERYAADPNSVVGKTDHDLHSPAMVEAYHAHDQAILESGEAEERWFRVPFADGSEHSVLVNKFPLVDADGQISGIGCISVDVTESEKAEAALRDSEEQLRLVTDNLPILIGLVDSEERYIWCNNVLGEWFQRPREEIIGRRIEEVGSAAHYKVIEPGIREVLSGKRTEKETTIDYPDGVTRHVHGIYLPKFARSGEVGGFYFFVHDISERKEAEQALREYSDRLKLITDNLPVLIMYVDAEERYKFVNRCCCEWYGREPEEILDKQVADIHGDNYSRYGDRFRRVRQGRTVEFEDRLAYPDGVTRDVRAIYLPHNAADGSVVGIFALVEDVTAFRQAEEQARQSQKMEAVGQLTGGVAHDFNNLLAVIIGNAEILVEDLGDSDPSPKAILRAARHGTELTQRLLAFSRRQPLDPQMVTLGKLVDDMSGMLGRMLGEAIEIEVVGEEGLWPALADAGQVENALLNLAINARDAMPGGGRLTIECMNTRLDAASLEGVSDVSPGDFVVLAVSDNGAGMPPSVLEHVFEPFFTTKEVGQGTGLGLSMVYGFARQSGGHVTVYSEEGTGTTVKLYLPRSRSEAVPSGPEDLAALPGGHGETVLLLEDDDDVRFLVVRILEGLGYRVIEAARAEAAGAVLAEAEQVDLLLSDVVLPGKYNGPDFARRARDTHPGLRIVFMSGYPAEAVRRNGFVDLGGAPLLKKPLDRRQLAEALHAVLRE
jgi:PAS domain S-box-containing protein